VFPYIINEERSRVPVNAGLESVEGAGLSERERLLNRMLAQLPNPWPGVRHDALTFNYALEYLKRARPRVLYIALDETDDFAHEKKYHQYIGAARRSDEMLRELWSWLQSTEGYRNQTTLLITTDHGRGNGPAWTDHWTGVAGAQHIWLAVIGPDTPARNVVSGQIFQKQVAATLAALLGWRYAPDPRTGQAIDSVLK
jgi:phosphopentomutase